MLTYADAKSSKLLEVAVQLGVRRVTSSDTTNSRTCDKQGSTDIEVECVSKHARTFTWPDQACVRP